MDERVLLKLHYENFNPTISVQYDWSGFSIIARVLEHMCITKYAPYRKMFQKKNIVA
jgi:hypothetical protein